MIGLILATMIATTAPAPTQKAAETCYETVQAQYNNAVQDGTKDPETFHKTAVGFKRCEGLAREAAADAPAWASHVGYSFSYARAALIEEQVTHQHIQAVKDARTAKAGLDDAMKAVFNTTNVEEAMNGTTDSGAAAFLDAVEAAEQVLAQIVGNPS